MLVVAVPPVGVTASQPVVLPALYKIAAAKSTSVVIDALQASVTMRIWTPLPTEYSQQGSAIIWQGSAPCGSGMGCGRVYCTGALHRISQFYLGWHCNLLLQVESPAQAMARQEQSLTQHPELGGWVAAVLVPVVIQH